MSQKQEIGDELPCGGYVQEDHYIKNNMKILSQEQDGKNETTKNQNQSTNGTCKNCTKQTKITQKVEQCKTCQQCSCCNNQKQNQKKVQTNKQEQIKEKKSSVKTICKKCKLQPSSLLHKNEPICKQCLLKNIEYKCRLTLQNSMKVKSDSKILICFSGGLNSISLVYLLSNLKKRYQKHHLFGELRCIHIQQQEKIPQDYKQIFQKQTGINLEIIKIGQIFEGQQKEISEVRKIFSMFNKAANSVDLLEIFRDRLIVKYARENKFDFIVKGLNGQTIATSIFKYFTKGIGGNVTQLSSIQPDCLFHFPLRQHLQKQLQFYFYSLKCSKISLKAQKDDLSNFCGSQIDNNLSDFLQSLQTMYSHTAPAITRTSQKIQSNRKNQLRCQWCMLKGILQNQGLCRKCSRILQNKNKLYDESILPAWFKLVK